jgi:hypothetical protein
MVIKEKLNFTLMINKIVENKKHTVIKNKGVFNFIYNQYTVFEYCNLLRCKEEVKHPTYKKIILRLYVNPSVD